MNNCDYREPNIEKAHKINEKMNVVTINYRELWFNTTFYS